MQAISQSTAIQPPPQKKHHPHNSIISAGWNLEYLAEQFEHAAVDDHVLLGQPVLGAKEVFLDRALQMQRRLCNGDGDTRQKSKSGDGVGRTGFCLTQTMPSTNARYPPPFLPRSIVSTRSRFRGTPPNHNAKSPTSTRMRKPTDARTRLGEAVLKALDFADELLVELLKVFLGLALERIRQLALNVRPPNRHVEFQRALRFQPTRDKRTKREGRSLVRARDLPVG